MVPVQYKMLILLILGLIVSTAWAQERPGLKTGEATPLHDKTVEPNRQLGVCTPGGKVVDYIRLELELATVPDGDWAVSITAGDSGWSRSIPAAKLQPAYWTGPIPGRCVIVRVPSDGATVRIKSLLVPINPAIPRNLFPPGEPADFSDPRDSSDDHIKFMSRGTVMLRYMKGANERSCSGQLLSNSLLITNNHCIADKRRANSATAYFRYRGGNLATAPKNESLSLLLTDQVLDVTFMELSQETPTATYFPAWRIGQPGAGELLAISQHPSGEAIQLSDDLDCRVRTVLKKGRRDEKVDFGHRCDTGDGSSGSVVFSRKKDCRHIVGLHHWGFDVFSDEAENQAVHVSLIKKFLELKASNGTATEKAAAQKILSAIKFESCGGEVARPST